MRFIPCLFLALALSTQITAQQSPSLDARVSHILARMKDKHLSTREAAFSDMMGLLSEERPQAWESGQAEVIASFFARHPDQADRVKLGLIQLLGLENETFTKGKPGSLTEDDTDYYAEVVRTVSTLNDERNIPALTGAMTTGGMAQQAIYQHGDKALAPVLEQLKSSDPLAQSSALRMSFALLAKRGGPASLAQIRALILAYVKAPSEPSRRIAVQEIDCLDDRQNFVPLLTEISRTDPEKRPGKALDDGDADGFYPVRADARQVLRDIQNNEGCRP
jgi:hypothetical protein